MSNGSHDAPGPGRGLRGVLALGLLAGTAGCSASPQYPINLGERAGDGSIISNQPRYAVSAADAAQNEADRRSQAGYPAYGAPPMADPSAPAPYAAAPPPPAATPTDDMADDAPRAPVASGGAVDSADLPPPGAAPSGAAPMGAAPPHTGAPDAADVPPADPAATPHEVSYAYGGGRVVFGMDWVVAPQPELAAYRHRHHAAAASETAPSEETADTSATRSKHRRHGKAASATDEVAPATPSRAAAADTPYQTVVKPGETLGEVAERLHSSKAALTALNDLKHPRHVKPGTVLKVPYRYSYEVQKGDTLYTIAHRFNQEPTAIARLNGLKAIPTLQPGQSIQLPPDASDQGRRDHASASGPEPEAAPARLADAALRKAERHGRHDRSRTAALNTAEASLPPQEIHRGRRSAARAEAQASAEAAPSAAETASAAPTPTPTPTVAPRPYVPAPAQTAATPPLPAATGEANRPAAVASAPATVTPRPYVPTPTAPRTYATTPSTPPYAATRPTTSAVGAAVGTASAASGGATIPYRSAAPTPSTYVAPGYAARAAPTGAGSYASLTPPRYTPAYPAAGGTTTPYTPSLGRERPAVPALSGGAASASDIASAGRGRFIWPVRGAVVSGFGAKGTGEYNNGVDISAAPGTGVRAAAAGDVVYAGSSIPGYGNMVLIKHAGGWVTAYAHLNRIEVRMHDSVSQGDEIGQAGQTGVVDRPELYFEVRYAASAADRPRPVDPALVLPAGGG